MSFLRQIVLIAVLAGIAAAPLLSQDKRNFETNTRSLKGVVTDRDGKAVSGAVVLLKDNKTLQVRSFITQEKGEYRFYGLSTNDEYEVRAQLSGNSSSSKTLSAFDNRKEATIDLKLK
jgi:protocatechuate 3,4-dioxygenase beta subunit